MSFRLWLEEAAKGGVSPADVARSHKLKHGSFGNWEDETGNVVATTTGGKFKWLDKKEGPAPSASELPSESSSGSQSPSGSQASQAPPNPSMAASGKEQKSAMFLKTKVPSPSDPDAYQSFSTSHSLIQSYDSVAVSAGQAKECLDKVVPDLAKKLNGINDKDELGQKDYLEKLIRDFNLTVNKKGDVRIMSIGDKDGIKAMAPASKDLKDYFDHFGKGAVQIPSSGGKAASEITAAAKPELGLTALHSSSFSDVSDMLTSKDLGDLDKKFHNIYGITNSDGIFIQNDSENHRQYLQDSITKNVSLDRTINKLKELETDGDIDEGLSDILSKHKDRMAAIASDVRKNDLWDKDEHGQSKLAKRIQSSYAKAIDDIYDKDRKVGLAVMKQLAETCAYESEVANKKEVYLPVSGNFPIGDKLRITRKAKGQDGKVTIEKVESISIKSGEDGLGFGSNVNQFTRLSKKDPDIVGHLRSGKHTVGIHDDILDKDDKWKGTVGKKLGAKSDTIQTFLKDYREEYKKLNVTTRPDSKTKAKIDDLNKKYAKKLKERIDEEEVAAIVGKSNASAVMKDPRALATCLGFQHSVASNGGFDKVEFNHMFIMPGGTMAMIIEKGSANMDNWKIGHRFDDEKAMSNASYEGPGFKKIKSELKKLKSRLTKDGIKGEEHKRRMREGLGDLCKQHGFPPPASLDESKSPLGTFLRSGVIMESGVDD